MKKEYNYIKEQIKIEKLYKINISFLNIYNNIIYHKDNIDLLKSNIKQHSKLINNQLLNGKKKYKSLILLREYLNSKDKSIAISKLENYINNKNLFKLEI